MPLQISFFFNSGLSDSDSFLPKEDAVGIANHGPEGPNEFLTGFGLTLETGNEAGSAAMTVERPE